MEEQQKVKLSLNLRTSSPSTLSIQDASPTEPLKLIATVKQTSSPFPDRPVTLLTKYSCLDTESAWLVRAMKSPQITVPDPQCPTPEIRMQPGSRITTTRITGDPDLLSRDDYSPFIFVTIPPLGQGHSEIVWELTPAELMRRLGDKDETVESKLRRLLRPGDAYKIVPSNVDIYWWTFGSLEDEGGQKKKVARWTLPDDLPLDRKEGEDETEEISHRVRDLVDLNDVNHLSSRGAIEGEQIPNIREMRSEGWVFGEPESALAIVVENQDEGAVFTITE